jgi:hypothetical protein
MGLFFTTTYIISVILYVIEGYIEPDGEHQKKYLIFLNVGLVYPVLYECIQAYKTGFLDYMSSN